MPLSEFDILSSGIHALGLPEEQDKTQLLLKFIHLIQKWNKVYNLTAIVNPIDMVRMHILDSLAVIPHLGSGRIADIGTGAGLPGIPLAIYKPENEYLLLDSSAKKTRFVNQVVVELKLKNVTVINTRVDQYHPKQKFNIVITRAFASIAEIKRLTEHLLVEEGEILAMKGLPTSQELREIIGSYAIIPLQVPGIDAERCLISMRTRQNKAELWEK